jgi:hypothetical protein
MKDTITHFIADVPAYILIAWVNFAEVIPADLTGVEQWFLHWGWLLLLALRLLNATIDLYKRSRAHDFTIVVDGEIKRVGIWKSIVHELKLLIK